MKSSERLRDQLELMTAAHAFAAERTIPIASARYEWRYSAAGRELVAISEETGEELTA